MNAESRPAADRFDAEFDLVVLGSGASGMTAALVAAVEGASVLVLESTSYVGGTSARSSGTLWIPPVGDTAAATYLDALVGEKADRSLREAFLAAGPAMIACLAMHAGFAFRPYPVHPDYRQDLPGAASGERPLEPPEFDGRLLGAEFARVGWPIPELMLFGGMMVTRGEASRLLRAGRSLDGTLLAVRLVLRFLADRLRYPRGTRLVLGNALVARLYRNLLDRQVPVWCETKTERLIVDGGVRGVVVRRGGKEMRVRARRGVVLAGGGFPASAALREQHFRPPVARHTPAYDGCVGDTLRLGQEAGGALGAVRRGQRALVSRIGRDAGRRNDCGLPAHRARPRQAGADRGRALGPALHRRSGVVPRVHARDVPHRQRSRVACLRPALRLEVRPRHDPADDAAPCAVRRLRIPAGRRTPSSASRAPSASRPRDSPTRVRRHNEFAQTGDRSRFRQGRQSRTTATTATRRASPIRASARSRTRPSMRCAWSRCRSVRASGCAPTPTRRSAMRPASRLAGLYAVGNDMQSVMGGEYPGAGAMLGPGMTFGYLAALHAVRPRAVRPSAAAQAFAT